MYGVLSQAPSSVELGPEYAHGKETREVRSSFLPTSCHQWVLMWSARIASMRAGMGMSRAQLGVAHTKGHEITH
jgi:hypothetical protein